MVTKFDLLKICPHPINPCMVELTGAELKEVLAQIMDEKWGEQYADIWTWFSWKSNGKNGI